MQKRDINITLSRLVELSIYEKRKRENKNKKRRLLIVRIDQMGDFIIFSPSLKYYKELYPGHHVTCLVNKVVASLAVRFTEVDEWIPFDRERFTRNLFYRRRLIRGIKEGGFDVAIYPTYSREPIGDYIIKASGAEKKITFDGDTVNIPQEEKARNDLIYTRLIRCDSRVIREIERNKMFMESLGAKTGDFTPCFVPSLDDEVEGDRVLFQSGLRGEKPYVVISPGAKWKGKIWPMEKYSQVISYLIERESFEVVICGSKLERDMVGVIRSNVSRPVVDITGRVSLPVLAAILKRASLVLGNDTGAIHLGAAVGTPVVCIMGGGQFGRFFPCGSQGKTRLVYRKMDCFGCDWRCKYSAIKCIQEIPVESVLEAISSMIQGSHCF